MLDLRTALQIIHDEVRDAAPLGVVADYIPPLACIDPDRFGMCVCTLDGEELAVGDVDQPFSTQSVTKVFTAAMVLAHQDILLWNRVGVEPSGTAFNSLVQLETEAGIPRNPFLNAGALVVADELCGLHDDPKQAILDFVRSLSENPSVDFDRAVARAESETGFTNRALAAYLKAHRNLHHDVDAVLDVYFHHCSIAMNTRCLARSFRFLANAGVVPGGPRILSGSAARRLNAVMLTCGFYDEAGEFAYQVGLPGKSGVGGGIAVVVPGKMSIAVWGPGLNEHGNSTRGIWALERFTSLTGLSVF